MSNNSEYINTFSHNYCFEEHVSFPLEVIWKQKVSDLHEVIARPIVVDNKVYILSSLKGGKGPFSPGILHCLNKETGQIIWEFRINERSGPVSQSCFIENQLITSTREGLIGIKNGEKVFQISLRERVLSIVPYYNGYIISTHKAVYAIDRKSNIITIFKGGTRPSTISFEDNYLLFGEKNSLFCFEINDFRLLWEKNVEEIGKYYDRIGSKTLKKDSYIKGKLRNRYIVISKDYIFCCVGIKMICLNLKSGKEIWKGDAMGDPVVSNNKVYSYCETGNFFCLNAADGNKQYNKIPATIRGLTVSLPFVSGNIFFVCANKILAINIDNGNLFWEFQSNIKDTLFFDPVFLNGRVYVGCSDGYIYCFGHNIK